MIFIQPKQGSIRRVKLFTSHLVVDLANPKPLITYSRYIVIHDTTLWPLIENNYYKNMKKWLGSALLNFCILEYIEMGLTIIGKTTANF